MYKTNHVTLRQFLLVVWLCFLTVFGNTVVVIMQIQSQVLFLFLHISSYHEHLLMWSLDLPKYYFQMTMYNIPVK